jgi:hypothetical protein
MAKWWIGWLGMELSIHRINPRWDEYFKAGDSGYLLTFILRFDEKAVGCSNIYLTHDMHNSDLIAQEDTIYVLPEHRNGIGKKICKSNIGRVKGARS